MFVVAIAADKDIPLIFVEKNPRTSKQACRLDETCDRIVGVFIPGRRTHLCVPVSLVLFLSLNGKLSHCFGETTRLDDEPFRLTSRELRISVNVHTQCGMIIETLVLHGSSISPRWLGIHYVMRAPRPFRSFLVHFFASSQTARQAACSPKNPQH